MSSGEYGLKGLRKHLGANAFDGRYKLSKYEGLEEAGKKWAPIHQRYKAIAPLLWEIAQDSGRPDGYYQSLRAPVRRIQELDAKRDWSLDPARPTTPLFVSDTLKDEAADSAEVASRLGEALSVETIDRHVGFLLVNHPFFDLEDALELNDADNMNRLLKAPPSTDGPYYLKHVQDLVDRRFTFEVRHHPDRMGSRWGENTIS